MKQLSIHLEGEFKDQESLVNEIEDSGHEVLASGGEVALACNCIVYSKFSSFEKRRYVGFSGYELIIDDKQLVLVKNEKEGYLLKEVANTEELSIDDIIDALISISRESYNEAKIVEILQTIKIIDADIEKQLHEWNNTWANYPENKTIHELFEEQVIRTPDNIALVYNDKKYSYSELNKKANQLAHYLRREYQLSGDNLVALCLDRDEQILIGILGVLKAGGAYVPLDPSYPKERISYILADTEVKVILTNEKYLEELNEFGIDSIGLDSKTQEEILAKESSINPEVRISSKNLAYVIYTSGTTGKPKGVMIEHHSVINLIMSIDKVYDLEFGNKITAFTSYTFDVSVSEFFTALLRGAELHLFAENIRRDPDAVSRYILANDINYVYLPPVVLASLPQIDYPKLHGIVYAGEPCDRNTASYWSSKKKLFNYYGPTETTVYSLGKLVIDGDVNLIGRPLNNTQAYVLDASLSLLPIGEIGELYIGGVGLARGYLNRGDLTTERFITNPFQSAEDKETGKNARLYKTGDLVRYLADGNIEYIGRNDFQVKIRGFRIELGEIENKLLEHPEIRQVVVLADEYKNANGEILPESKYLAAFYIANKTLAENELHEFLGSRLPDYMHPSAFVAINKLPLTINGKLDRKALLGMLTEKVTDDYDYSDYPEIESYLAKLWQELIVLNNRKIELNDSFFGLGGHSLLVTKLILKIRNEYGIVLTPHQIYEAGTLSGLANLIRDRSDSEQQETAIPKLYSESPNYYLLNKYQLSIYFAHQSDPIAYTVPVFIKCDSLLDSEKAKLAFKKLVNKHRILSGYIQQSDEGLTHIIHADKVEIITQRLDESDLDNSINRLASNGFDLGENVTDFRIFEIDADKPYTVLSFTHHHIVADGYSIDLILKDYFDFYANTQMQRDSYAASEISQILISKYDNFDTPNFIKQIYPQNPQFTLPGQITNNKLSAILSLDFSNQDQENMRFLAQKYATTINAIMISILYIAFYRYTSEDEINLGIVFANRENPFAEDVVACLVNTLPLAINFKTNNEADTYAGFIDRLVKRLNAYMEYSAYPLLDILADSEDKSLFQIVFASQHIIHKSNNYTKLDYSNKSAKFDLAFNFYHTLDPEVLEVEFNASKYSRNYIERFLSSVKNILTQLAINPENRLTTINLLDYQDYQQQIYSWNETSVSYDKDLTIAELFVKQVNKTPDSTALVYQDKELSYRELDEKANQLANFLIKEYQIKGDDLVALCLKRNENMLITILGVIKAGGAYVPIDPEYPDDRIEYVLEDTKAKVVLTNQEYMGRLCKLGGNPIAVDDKEIETCLNQQSVVAPLLEIDSTNLAYVIYTSGTTGKPKGVMIEHRNVMNLCNEFIHAHKLDVYQEIAIYSNYVFDAFVYETIPALVNGNKLFLLDEDKRLSVDNLAKYLRVNQIKVMFIPTILLKEFLITLKDKNPLKLIYTGGEKLPELDPEYIPRGLTILNEYGPTESTVCSTYKEYHPGVQSSNIGKPIKNIMTYILDPNFMPLPQGVVGELYIGGDSLGRGYLNRPELTKEKFIANPFQSKEDQAKNRNNRIYKTGDLVRYFENGEIEYIGRNDFQVKIRGFRIELGEIEVALNHYCSINADNAQIYPIRQSVVLVMGDESSNKASEDKYIVAYYVSNEPLLEEVLFSHLKANLPEYMLPSVLIHLEKLPQTVNGKLDRKKLPKPELRSNKNYVAPRGEFDFRICEIYADILGLELSLLGIDDDFFRLGGNSIKAIKVVNRLSNELDFKITITDFFKYSTIRQLIDNCRDLYSDKELVTIPKSFDLSDDSNDSQLPLSFAQERLWFYEKYSGGSYAYNIPVLYELGTQVNCDKLTKALQEVVKRHKTLHSLIDTDVNGQGYTRVINLDKKPLIIDQYSLESIDELMKLMQKEANHIYDLAKEYPLRASLYRLKDNRLFLSLVVHHIAFDGWSMDIFLHDLYQFYINDQDSTDLPKLTKLAINYIDFASWQKNFLTGDKLQMQLNYWKDKLNDYSGFSLKTDFLRPALVNNSGDNVYFDLDTILSNDLRKIAKKLGVSLYTVLLSGFYLFLRVYSNQNDLVVGSPVANRNYPELENIIGFFVNTLALRSTIDPNEILANYIREVGRVSLLSQSYQDTPFEKIVNELKITKDQSRHPLFQILFSVQDFGSTNKLDSYSGLFAKGSEFAGIFSGYKVAKFDLTVMLNDAEEVISGVFNYATSLYKQDTIIGFIDTYKLILSQFLTKLDAPIAKLAYLTKDDYSKVIYQWNKTDHEYLIEDLFIHKLFEKQVLKNPDKIALNYAGLSLSYSQLNSRSNRLANYLRKTYDISKNDLIILFLKRSELIPLSILAVLKAGAAYVPVDPDIPEERLSYILADTASKVTLTNLSSSDKLNRVINKDKHNIKVEFLDGFDFIDNRLSELNPEFNLSHDSLAYVIYTSGTTGNPKGVIHSHHGLANGVLNELDLGIVDANSRVLGKTAYVYDPSVRETFMPLLSGGELCLVDEEIIKDNERLLKCIKENNISLAIFTPSHLNVFISALEDIGDFESLNGLTIFSCGEPINSQLRDKVVKEFGVTLHVQYGVSELSQVFYRYKINADNLEFSLSHNNKAYILDAMLNLLPIGSIGELYMGGDGLFLGYLNLPELTAERFIRNPFQTEVEKINNKNARLYKTGDLVYYHQDGSIEYIGRNDFQIKIRGFRVELAEIENRLLAYSGIRHAIVVAKEIAGAKDSSSKYLLAYYVADEPLNEESIYKYLTNTLPDYMLPHKIVYLRELPLTINGKLDRKALPSPDFYQTNEFIPPRTELESIVCNTMIDILGMEDRLVSIKDDFFMLGGNSILSIKLASKLNNTLGSKLKVAEIFSAKTVENIAKLIDSYGEGDFQTLVQLNHAPKNPSIVMFHPATGGCEVYSNLASRLTAYYQCYGIDNYNLHHKLKYTDLASLTDYYLQTIKTNGIIKEDKSHAITMFGWCLGGLFALEAAAILESEGYSNISVYILDTVIHDDKLHEVTDRIDHGFIKKFMKDALSTKYEEGYVNKIIDNFDTENSIGRGRPRQRLEKTRVYLYKAMQKDTRVQLDILDAVFKEVREIKSNNLELAVMNPKEQINLFTLYDAHHGNILEQDIVVEHLISHINNLK